MPPYLPRTAETSTATTHYSRCQWTDCCNLLAPKPPLKRGPSQRFCDVDWHRGCLVEGCNRRHRAKGLCSAHWKAKDRAENGRNEPWNDTMRDAYHRRRALVSISEVEPIRRAKVAARDNYTCRLCGDPVDMTLPYPRWGSPSVDHATPLSRGGSHRLNNVVLAHLGCNLEKRQMTMKEWFAYRQSA